WHGILNARDAGSKALADARGIRTVNQARADVTAVVAVDLAQAAAALLQFIQLPLGCARVQVSDALSHNGRTPRWHKQNQAFDVRSGIAGAAVVKPQETERHSRIDRALSLLRIHAQERESRPAAPDQRPGVHRTERAL